jgi:hypothetical protein
MEIGLEKIKSLSASTILVMILGNTIPGFLFLFIFKRGMFLSLDLFRLSIISISISSPIYILNCIFSFIGATSTGLTLSSDEISHKIFSATGLLGGVVAMGVIFITTLLGYLLHWDFLKAIYCLLILQGLVIGMFIFSYSTGKKGKKQKT